MQKLLIGILVLTLVSSCASKRLTQEDVAKKVETAREANEEAKEKTVEAINARNQFTSDYKLTEIEKIDKRIKNIDKQMKSIKKSAKNDANETVATSLGTAVDALKEEKTVLTSKKAEIQNIQAENWQDNLTEIDSVMIIINNNLTEVEVSLDRLSK